MDSAAAGLLDRIEYEALDVLCRLDSFRCALGNLAAMPDPEGDRLADLEHAVRSAHRTVRQALDRLEPSFKEAAAVLEAGALDSP